MTINVKEINLKKKILVLQLDFYALTSFKATTNIECFQAKWSTNFFL